MPKKGSHFNRREFLQAGALATMGISLSANQQGKQEKKSEKPHPKKILNYQPDMRYRRLGNTEIYLSVLSLGGIGIKKEVALYAIDHGVNLVHMSSTYNSGNSIKILASLIKERPGKFYIALKDTFNDIDNPLKTMNADYVDFLMFNRHSASDVNDPEIVEQFDKWKAQGKVRFAGLTSHDDVKDCVSAGIRSGFYRIIQPALNQPSFELLQEELKQAYERGIAIMVMKSMKGLNDEKMQTALLKKFLNNPAITTINKHFNSFDLFDLFRKTMNETLTSQEDFDLYRYAQKNRSNNCMMCGQCRRSCPQQIEIPALLRCKDYYLDQLGDHALAVETYQTISVNRRFSYFCSMCGLCEKACPNGIPIVQRLRDASDVLENLVA